MTKEFAILLTLSLTAGGCDGRNAVTPVASPEPRTASQTAAPSSKASPAAPAVAADAGAPQAWPMRAAFEKELRDGAWAQPLEGVIQGVVQSVPEAKLVSADCRTTVCRVVVSHPPGRIGATWHQTLSSKLLAAFPDKPYHGAFMYEQTPDMAQSTTYFTRNGFGEPNVDGSPRAKAPPPAAP